MLKTSTPPLVSVCIPVYNGGEFIGPAIESVLGQTFENFELVIVENSSTDQTLEIARQYAKSDSRIRIIANERNIGMEANWNKALSEARGAYIKLLPADDLLYPNCLERQMAIFEHPEHKDVSLVCCARDIVSYKDKKLMVRGATRRPQKLESVTAIRKIIRSGTNPLGEPGAILFRAAILKKTGLFNGSIPYVIDLDLWLRILRHGSAFLLPDILCAFRLSQSSCSVNIGTAQSQEFDRFIRKLYADPQYNIRWLDQIIGRSMCRILSLLRVLFYRLTSLKPGSSTGQ